MSDRPDHPSSTPADQSTPNTPSPEKPRHAPRHPERIEESWPHYDQGEESAVTELAAEHQGADAPFGSDLHPPIDLAAYRREAHRERHRDGDDAGT